MTVDARIHVGPPECLINCRHPGRVFLGDDLLAWLVLAVGGALFVGNVVAIVRPPDKPEDRRPRTGAARRGRW